jgi:hypothetical protein
LELADDLAFLDLGCRLTRCSEGDLSVLQNPSQLPTIGVEWSGGGISDDPPHIREE